MRPAKMSAGVGIGLRFEPGVSNPAYATGTNELPVQQVLQDYLRPGSVFYDVGANVGYFTVMAARLIGPGGGVFAFEPVADNARYIRLNGSINALDNIVVVEKAVADKTGRAELLVTHYSGGSALATADQRAPDVARSVFVDTVAIDDLVFAQGCPAPDLIKIDVEGAELQVLRGMERVFREFGPVVIYEIDDLDAVAYERKQKACDSFLRAIGYRLSRLEGSYPSTRSLVGHTLAVVGGDSE